MPNINLDDAYILDETGAQVGAVTDIPFKADAGLTDAQKAQARANLGISGGGGGGGRNLLDNPWFTVNQRAATTISGSSAGVFSVDRWRLYGSTTSLTVTNDGVQVNSASNGLLQRFDDNIGAYLNGKTVTVSAMDKDGNIASKSLTYSNASMQNTGTLTLGNKTCTIYLGLISSYQAFSITTGSYTIDLRAVKLELGSTSTLAQDAPPDYAEELAKCQRYFLRLNSVLNFPYAIGIAHNASSLRLLIPTPTTMRKAPTLSFTGSLVARGNGSSLTVSSLSNSYLADNGVALDATTTGATQYQTYSLVPSSAGRIDLSADL